MLLPQRYSKAFTLLELIVVVVILAILAAIAIPSFQKVINKTHDHVAMTELAALQRAAWAEAAIGETHLYDVALFQGNYGADALAPGALAPGVYAEAYAAPDRLGLVGAGRDGAGPSTRHGEVSLAVTGGSLTVHMAMRSKSGNCVFYSGTEGTLTYNAAHEDVTTCQVSAAMRPVVPFPDTDGDGVPGPAPDTDGDGVPDQGGTVDHEFPGTPVVTDPSMPGTPGNGPADPTDPAAPTDPSAPATPVSYPPPGASSGPWEPGTPVTSPTASPAGVPAPPTVTCQSVYDQTGVKWDPVSGATHYLVSLDGGAGRSTTELFYNGPKDHGVTHTYSVRAVNAAGASAASTCTATSAAIQAPYVTLSNVTSSSLTVSWTAQPYATSYAVYQGGSLLADVSAPTQQYDVTGLSAGTSYSFHVRGTAPDGNTVSNTATVTTSSAVSGCFVTSSNVCTAAKTSAPFGDGGTITVLASPAKGASGAFTVQVSGLNSSFDPYYLRPYFTGFCTVLNATSCETHASSYGPNDAIGSYGWSQPYSATNCAAWYSCGNRTTTWETQGMVSTADGYSRFCFSGASYSGCTLEFKWVPGSY